MHVRFWGTRGSLPKPGPDTLLFGGNTACVEVRTAADTLVIIDCGSGLHGLGQSLVKPGKPVLKRAYPHQSYPLGSHSGHPFLCSVLRSGKRMGHLRAQRDWAVLAGYAGWADAVCLFSCETRRNGRQDPLSRTVRR